MSTKTELEQIAHVEPCVCQGCRDDEMHIIEAQLAVMKDKVAEQAVSYDRMHNKMFALLGLELTVAGLFTYDVFKIPESAIAARSGKIFLTLAIACLLLSALVILLNYRARRGYWSSPMGPLERDRMKHTKNTMKALRILLDDYVLCRDQREQALAQRALYTNVSLYLFIVSITLLLVLKVGG